MEKTLIYLQRKKDTTTAWLLFLGLGFSYGYLGRGWLQVIWYFLAFFSIIVFWRAFFGTIGAVFSENEESAAAAAGVMTTTYVVSSIALSVWWVIRLFTLNGDIKRYNIGIAMGLKMTTEEMQAAGLIDTAATFLYTDKDSIDP